MPIKYIGQITTTLISITGFRFRTGFIPVAVPFCGSYLESYKAVSKRNYYGAFYGSLPIVSIVVPFLVNQELYYRILTKKRNYNGDYR